MSFPEETWLDWPCPRRSCATTRKPFCARKSKRTACRLAPRQRRRQLLALIIIDKPDTVSDRILTDLKRGVTAISSKGMCTGKDRSILLCALTITEAHNLKSAVAKEDPKAVVIVSPAQEILGGGFAPPGELALDKNSF